MLCLFLLNAIVARSSLPAVGLVKDATAVLTRDVDKRPLQRVALSDLTPAMRRAIRPILRETPRAASFTVERVPVAPRGHRLYVLSLSGAKVCSLNGPNCPLTVFDETSGQVATIADTSGVGVAVVRRPMLQMPDIATYEQLGHFAVYTTVYRLSGDKWKAYLCKDAPIADAEDPHPEWVAYEPCQP